MKHAQNPRRGRGRSGGGKRSQPSKNRNFESNGGESKVRGTAQQILDKYLSLARDAQSAGDRITAEGYFQHAEHYYRILYGDRDTSAGNGGVSQDRGVKIPPPAGAKPEGQEQRNYQDAPSGDIEAGTDKAAPAAAPVVSDAAPAVAEAEEPKRRPRGRPRKVKADEPAADSDPSNDGDKNPEPVSA